MNETQIILAVLFPATALLSVAIGVRVIKSTAPGEQRKGADIEALAERENRYAVLVTMLLIGLLAITLFFIPYGEGAEDDAQQVTVEAFQYGWKVTPSNIQAGRQIEFRLRSQDVQHGFGVYQGDKLIKQVQVPANTPGSDDPLGPEQRMVLTLDEPGTYRIACLEFCGSGHHLMVGEFEVVG